jgi:hypothetical protein
LDLVCAGFVRFPLASHNMLYLPLFPPAGTGCRREPGAFPRARERAGRIVSAPSSIVVHSRWREARLGPREAHRAWAVTRGPVPGYVLDIRRHTRRAAVSLPMHGTSGALRERETGGTTVSSPVVNCGPSPTVRGSGSLGLVGRV